MTEQTVHDFTSVPPGVYLCEVAEVRTGKTRAGEDDVEACGEGTAGEAAGAGEEVDGPHAPPPSSRSPLAEMVLVPGAAKSLVALADKVADRILGIRARRAVLRTSADSRDTGTAGGGA